jgi:hypothetical protein
MWSGPVPSPQNTSHYPCLYKMACDPDSGIEKMKGVASLTTVKWGEVEGEHAAAQWVEARRVARGESRHSERENSRERERMMEGYQDANEMAHDGSLQSNSIPVNLYLSISNPTTIIFFTDVDNSSMEQRDPLSYKEIPFLYNLELCRIFFIA